MTEQPTPRPIEERLAEIGASVPDSEWDRVPHDLAANLDQYLYGGKGMPEPTRLTAEQQAEWAEQVDYARGYVCDRIASPWASAIIAVDLELTALRKRVEAQATQIEAFTDALAGASVAVLNGRTALAKARVALTSARKALEHYLYHVPAWATAARAKAKGALEIIDAALGKEED